MAIAEKSHSLQTAGGNGYDIAQARRHVRRGFANAPTNYCAIRSEREGVAITCRDRQNITSRNRNIGYADLNGAPDVNASVRAHDGAMGCPTGESRDGSKKRRDIGRARRTTLAVVIAEAKADQRTVVTLDKAVPVPGR